MSNLEKTSASIGMIFLLVLGLSFLTLLEAANAQVQAHDFSITSSIGGKNFTITGMSLGNATALPKSFKINPNQSIDIEVNGKGNIQLALPKAMIDGIMVVTSGNEQIYHKEVSADATFTTIQVSIPKDVGSIKIVAARVIPEFPLPLTATIGTLLGMAAVIGSSRFFKH